MPAGLDGRVWVPILPSRPILLTLPPSHRIQRGWKKGFECSSIGHEIEERRDEESRGAALTRSRPGSSRGLAGRRRRDGEVGPVDGLGQDAPGRHLALAAEPADDGQPLPGLELSDLPRLGTQARSDLQRRLLADLRREAPALGRSGLQRMLGLGLACHRRGIRAGAWGPDLVPRKSADVPGPQRLSRGDVLHLLVQSHSGRDGQGRGALPPGDRDHRQDARRAAHARTARPRCPRRQGAIARGGIHARRSEPLGVRARSAFPSLLCRR